MFLPDLLSYKEACRKTFLHCPDGYAKAYANAGYGLGTEEEIQTQCLYILGNMGTWRGPIAKECREVFKRLAKPPKKRRARA